MNQANKVDQNKNILKGGTMKTKSFSKKLMLNKKTIVNLENGEMNDVQGGVPESTTAVSIVTNCCFCNFSRPDMPC